MKKIFALFFLMSISLGYSQTELITNGNFAGGTASWTGNNFSVVSGEAYISSTNLGGNLWDTQLVQGGMSFTSGTQYTLTFKARAASNRNITVAIQNVGAWTDQFRETYALTTTMQTFTSTFTSEFSNGNVQIGFLMAAQGSTAAVYFDDVSITSAVTGPPVSNYCNHTITSGSSQIKVSMEQPTTNNYKITIKSDVTMTGLHGGWYIGTSAGNIQAVNNYVLSDDGKTITVTFSSTSPPNMYTNIHVLYPGLVLFANPSGITWGTCGSEVVDTEAPTSFTASVGVITSNSVELLLNGEDNSGSVTYNVSYGSGSTATTTSASGVQKSLIISGLTSETLYNFSVQASDAAGNTATNNPIVLPATTLENTNTNCSGFDTQASQESFITGYNYNFSTSGSDVTVEFELLDDRTGVNAYAWTYNPNFSELQMTLVSGRKFTRTFSGQAIGSTFTVACKFAFAGGLAVTKQFTYTVGDNCDGGGTLLNPSFNPWSIASKQVGDADFEITPPISTSSGAFTYFSSNTAVATINGNEIQIVGVGTTTITANQAATEEYNAGSATATFTVTVPPLAVAAPTPPARNAWDVISLYSDAYVTQSSPNWQNAATTTDELLEGNNTKKMSNFQVELIGFSATDVSQMTTLHLDIYSDDCTALNIWLNSNGDKRAQISVSLNGWNSIDIPLSIYAEQGLIMSGINLLKFESLNGGGKTVYVDNIYFYRPATLLSPTITDFSVPTKALGDASFALTAPASDSSGAFTYSSSNENVATINGNTVTITGIGTTTITANQAADGSFDTGSISADFQVTVPSITLNMATANNYTLPNFSMAVAAHGYIFPAATTATYRFMIVNTTTGASEEVYSPTRFVTIPNTLRTYNSNYTITAAAVINGEDVPYAGNIIVVNSPVIPKIKLAPTSCDVTVATLSATLSANPGLNVTGYRFRLRLTSDNGATPTYYYATPTGRFTTLSSFVGFTPQYSSSYTVDVEYSFVDVSVVGQPVIWSGPGDTCTITTPGIPTIGLSSPICGTRVTSKNATISATPALYVMNYEFRLRLTSDNGVNPTYYTTTPSSNRFSTLGSFNGLTVAYNASYTIDVRYQVMNNGVTAWSNYGTSCVILSPEFPTTGITASICNSSRTLSEVLTITPVSGATYQVYLYEQLVDEEVVLVGSIPRNAPNFSLNMFAGTTVDKNYTAYVAVKLGSEEGSVGQGCDISTYPAASPEARVAQVPFAVKAYPNPYSNTFQLDVTSTDKTASIGIKVYDMLGRMVDNKNTTAGDLETTTIGSDYPSGVYNVIVTQGDETKTVRVVKR